MATLIVYATTHGCSEKAVRMLMTGLHDDITVLRLETSDPPDLSAFDRVIVGGSIHMGGIQKEIRKFCEKHLDVLLQKTLGLFLCCMFDGEVAKKQFDDAFPETLRSHAKATGLFGGELDFDKMNMLEKMIVKKVAKVDQSVSRINEAAIRGFAGEMVG